MPLRLKADTQQGRTKMEFLQDKRVWIVIAVIVVLLIIWGFWPGGEAPAPEAPAD